MFLISFEFFPPKTPEGKQNFCNTAQILAQQHQPHFFSVTFGAGGSTREGTVEAVKILQEKTKVDVAPHLSCIGSNRADILAMLKCYKALGIRRVVTLRGDLPSGMGQAGEFKYASELVNLIRQETGDDFYIEVAAYPEMHPQALSMQEDILNLKRKYEAGANGAITQYFFNPDAYFYYVDECAKQNIRLPIVPGIMPITQFNRLARFSAACGAEIPQWIRRRLEAYGDDTDSIKKFGAEVVYRLCQTLIAGGAPGLHFYTLNQVDGVTPVLEHLLSASQPVKMPGAQ